MSACLVDDSRQPREAHGPAGLAGGAAPQATARSEPTGDPAGAAVAPSVLAYLQAVVAASARLVAETDLQRGVDAAVHALRETTGLDRVYVFRDVPGRSGVVLYSESLGPGVPSIHELFGDRLYRDDEFLEVIPPLRAGSVYQSVHPKRTGENATSNEAAATRSDLMVPIMVDGRFWGIVGFDDCHNDRIWAPAEVAALQGAASAIAAAVLREAALLERQRHNQRYEGLLRAASAASRHLAAEADLDTGLQLALDALRQDVRTDRVFLVRYAPAEKAGYFWMESREAGIAPFVTGFGPGPWPDEAYAQVTGPLLQGQVYRSLAHQREGDNARHNDVNGSLSDLIVPIFVEGRYRAFLGFDDHRTARVWHDADVAVLQTVAAAMASAIRRDEVVAVREQERQRYEGLLRGVAEASRHLLAAPDLGEGLSKAMEALGIHAAQSRAYTWELSSDQQHCFLLAEWDAPGIACVFDLAGTKTFALADYQEVWRPLLAGRVYQSVTPLKTGANADLNFTVATRSDVMVPIFVGGRCWGCIGFDNCVEERTYSPAEIDVLMSAAHAVAAAIARYRAEDARLAADRQRADESAQLNRLLEGVVDASRALLEDDDFDNALKRWLAFLATAVGADRAVYGDLSPPEQAAVASIHIDWHKSGRPTVHRDAPPTRDFIAWAGRLAQGESIWAHRDELLDPLSVSFWEEESCWTTLIVPVVVDRRTVGWLCFDFETRREWEPAFSAVLRTAADGAAAAIKRRWAVLAMLAERDRRIEAERLRAEESARMVERVDRHAQLLAAVATSAEDLLAAREPWDCMDAILARLSEKSGAQRATLNRFDWTPDDPELRGWQEVVHEWTAPGEARQMDTPMRRFPMRRDEAIYDRLEEEFRATGRIVVKIAEQAAKYREEQQSLGVAWSLGVPFFVDGVIWGALGFDYSTPFGRHDEAEFAALQTVASSIADALTRQRLEVRTLAVERERADENARIVGLLEVVLRSSRTLFDAADFEPALRRWLGDFGQATGAQRATFYDIALHEESGLRSMRMLCEWVREGVAGNIPVSFEAPFVIDPRGAEQAMAAVLTGEVVCAHVEDTHGPHRDLMTAQGNATVLVLPIVMGGSTWGCLSFDFATRTELSASAVAVLTTANDTLAVIVKRNESTQLALEERDRRIELEHRSLAAERVRADALRTANDELIASMSRLVALNDIPAFLDQLLLSMTRACGARTGTLLAIDGPDDALRMRRCVIDETSIAIETDERMVLWRDPLPASLSKVLRERSGSEVLICTALDQIDAPDDWAADLRWHAEFGHRLRLQFPLNVGGELLGIIVMGLAREQAPSDFLLQQAVVLAQQAAIALQMERLARQVESSAVRAERDRMAAEIHDSLAQSFTSIAMQSESLAGLVGEGTESRRVLRLIEHTARQGLSEARTAVLALQPLDTAPGAFERALTQLAERSSIRGGIACDFECSGTAFELSSFERESLLRIAQEATSNAMRHSGGSSVSVRILYAHPSVQLIVEDNGSGFRCGTDSKQSGGFGMGGMRQRAADIGASFQISAPVGGGTAIRVELACRDRGAPCDE